MVSPLLPQSYLDFQFYVDSLHKYASSWASVVDGFVQFYRDPFNHNVTGLISGPMFPLLMGVSGFADGNFLPLALFYLAISTGLTWAWLVWLRRHGVGGAWLVGFAVIPNPIWFTLVVSPDLLFAAEFAVFFFAYFSQEKSRTRTAIWLTALALLILTRPNSFSIALFVALDAAWMLVRGQHVALPRAIGLTMLLVISGLYLFPYFVFEMNKAGNTLTYYGYTPFQYLQGLHPGLPAWLDLPISWLSLMFAKLAYFTGLRPSYGITPTAVVMLRAAAGFVLLPGLVLLLAAAPWRIRALVALYCLPFVLGPAQDRYYIAIFPVLYLYGAQAWTAVLRTLSGGARLATLR